MEEEKKNLLKRVGMEKKAFICETKDMGMKGKRAKSLT